VDAGREATYLEIVIWDLPTEGRYRWLTKKQVVQKQDKAVI